MNNVRLYINGFIDYFGELITTRDEDIDTFVRDTHTPNMARVTAARIIIGSRVSTHIKDFRIELNDSKICTALPDKDNLNAINMNQVNILISKRN